MGLGFGWETLGLISLGEPRYMQDLEQQQIPLFMTQEWLAPFKGVIASWEVIFILQFVEGTIIS